VIAVYEVGEHRIPPVTVRYRTAEGEERELASEPITITVESLAPEEATDFRDIKGPVSTIPDYSRRNTVLAIAGAVLLLLLVAGLLLRRWLKRRQGWTPPPPPPRPADELAREALAALLEEDLLARGEIKEFVVRLDTIVKELLGAVFDFDALERTTPEVLETLGERCPDHVRELIQGFLSDCDLVKFARWTPPEERLQALVAEARQIIDTARPLPPPAPAPSGPPEAADEAPEGPPAPDSSASECAGAPEEVEP